MSIRLLDAYPDAALTGPGTPVRLQLDLHNDGAPAKGELRAELRDAARVVGRERVVVELPSGRQRLCIPLPTPPEDARGYEAVLELETQGFAQEARTAVLVASHWRHAPRYGFLSEFPPGDLALDRVRELAKLHITVVQFYDWMYRHYRFLPPQDEFTDAMGRELSLETVRRRIATCHEAGMAALAYGAVYGAEPEFIEQHPEWVLRDARGEKLSLIDLFYIMDLRPDVPWRELILQEFESAVGEVGFDGIHMDQYGFPKWSYDANGTSVDLAEQFPSMIDEAAERVAQQREGAAVLFNAVNNWPVEQVAASDQAAVYIEVWSPHDHYRDLVDLVRRARDLSGKHVVLAAYLEPFREGGEGAEQAALLATAVIASAGGFHLLLGEGNAVLRDGYYANHGHMRPEFVPRMRRYYDHTAAHHHHLFDPSLQDVTTSFMTGVNNEIALSGAPLRTRPEAGSVWGVVKQLGDRFVINLVNLIGLDDTTWNRPKDRTEVLEGLSLDLDRHFRVKRAIWSSPDEDSPARELTLDRREGGTRVALPALELWGTVMLEVE